MIGQKLPNSSSENFDHLEIFQIASDLDKEMMMTPSVQFLIIDNGL
jgi:hypothetical protein